MNKVFLIFVLLLLSLSKAETLSIKKIKVAILAPMGKEATLKSWEGFKTLLEKDFPEDEIILMPVTIEQFQKVALNNEADLLIANQTAFLSVFPDIKLRWIASLDRNSGAFNPSSVVGSTILVRSDSDIHTIKDLKKKRVSAVSKDALGGFLLGYKAIYKEGLESPRDYFVTFTGYPIERGVFTVQSQLVDAAIIPTCLYENMVKAEQIDPKDFRLIAATETADGCISSTPLAYNWSLAALSTMTEHDAQIIQKALFENEDPTLTTWRLPVGLGEIYAMKRFAGLIKVEETLWETFWRITNQYKLWIIAIAFIMLLLALNHGWLTWIARKRRVALESSYHRLHEYEKMLSRADRVNILGEVASGIGHELNQPLMAIRNYAEGSLLGLQKGRDPQSFVQPIERIVQQVEQCSSIIKNLQSWVKPKTMDQFEWFNFNDFMARMIEIIHLQTKNRVEIELHINCDQKVFTVVSILEQVMMNSLLNAVQAGANQIIIEAHCHQDYYKILIMDNGSGFTKEELDAPFVPFRTSKPTGLGLGLVICERLMAVIGGKFRIDNRKDGEQGASVRIIIPTGSTIEENK